MPGISDRCHDAVVLLRLARRHFREILFAAFIVAVVAWLALDQLALDRRCQEHGGRTEGAVGRRAPQFCRLPDGTRIDLRDLDAAPTP